MRDPLHQPLQRVPLAIWLTAFLQGAAVLAIEVLGARMLTPYFGTSHYVWTAQITVTLLSLALGYAWGARLGDLPATRLRAVRLGLLLAGGYAGCTPLVVQRLSYVSYHVPLSIGALLTSVALFAAPLAALASISPCLVGESAGYVPNAVAQISGRLAAVSTGGSVAGVLVVAYGCIPYMATSFAMYGLASLLLLGACATAFRHRRARGTIVAAGILLVCIAGGAHHEVGAHRPRTRRFEEIARAHSVYSTLQVWRSLNSSVLTLSTNLTFQNDYDPVTHEGTDAFAFVLSELVRSYAPSARRALLIGLGVGVVPRNLARFGVSTDVFELDPIVPELASRYFDADLTRTRVRVGDGRRLLHEATEAFDLVLLDAFHGDSTPSHLLSREAFQSMADVLTPGGMLVANMWRDLEHDDELMPVVLRTLQSVFRHVVVHDAHVGNYYIVASNRADLSPMNSYDVALVPAREKKAVLASLQARREVEPSQGLILTDDYNPADTLAARYYEYVRRASAGLARPR